VCGKREEVERKIVKDQEVSAEEGESRRLR